MSAVERTSGRGAPPLRVRFFEFATLAELKQSVADLGLARDGYDVADGKGVFGTLEGVDASVVLLEQYALFVRTYDRRAFYFERRAGVGREHVGQRALAALNDEARFGEADVAARARHQLERRVVDARDARYRTALVGRNRLLCVISSLERVNFEGFAVARLHRDVAFVAVGIPCAGFTGFGLYGFDRYVLRFVLLELVGRDGYRLQRIDVFRYLGFVAGRKL